MAKALSKSQIAATIAEKNGISKRQATDILDTISQPFQPHRTDYALNIDLLTWIDEHSFAREVIRAVDASIVDVVPGISSPAINPPVEQPCEIKALVDEAWLNAKIDGVEINQPLGRIGVLNQRVIGPSGVSFLQDAGDL